MVSERAFFGVPAMSEMPMSGGLTMLMVWMRLSSGQSMPAVRS
jgi:hypothetical protein